MNLETWEIQAPRDYDNAANWKLIAEGFMEYYHLLGFTCSWPRSHG